MHGCIAAESALRMWRSGRLPASAFASIRQATPSIAPSISEEEYRYLAKRFGIEGPVRFVVAEPKHRRKGKLHASIVEKPAFQRTCFRITDNVYLSSPEDTVRDIAVLMSARKLHEKMSWKCPDGLHHLPAIAAALLLTEMRGCYHLSGEYPGGFCERPQELITEEGLSVYLAEKAAMRGVKWLRIARPFSVSGCASPAETALFAFMCFPKTWGGMGFPLPEANWEICTKKGENKGKGVGKSAGKGAGKDEGKGVGKGAGKGEGVRRADFCWPEHKLILEYNGGYHEGQRANADDVRRNELTQLGYQVFTANADQLFCYARLQLEIFAPIKEIVGSTGRAPANHRQRQNDLRALVFEFNGTKCAENTGVFSPFRIGPRP